LPEGNCDKTDQRSIISTSFSIKPHTRERSETPMTRKLILMI